LRIDKNATREGKRSAWRRSAIASQTPSGPLRAKSKDS
jgi:hypothetical protein